MGFEKWAGCHGTEDQQKRRAKSKDAACTPLSVVAANQSGEFSGSGGVYHTTLEECSCVDFRRRKLPCKHMYRLAMELGVVRDDFQADPRKVKWKKPEGYSLEEAVAIVESLSDDARGSVRQALRQILYIDKDLPCPVICVGGVQSAVDELVLRFTDDFPRALMVYGRNELREKLHAAGIDEFNGNMKKEALIQWIVENVPEATKIFNECGCVEIGDKFLKSARKLYSYLLFRDGQGDAFFDVETGLVQTVERVPDETTARLLEMYAPNRGDK